MRRTRKKTVKKADLNTRAGKFLTARYVKGMNKQQAAETVGLDPRNVNMLEKTQVYQALEKKYFRDELAKQIGLDSIAGELIKNIVQDEDRGAKNKAIEIALSKIEPDKHSDNTDNERVYVILK